MESLDYGVIGNCRSAALVSKEGSIDWLCLPDFDAPSLFAKLLDTSSGGSFGFETAPEYRISQKYLERTNILCTRFESKEGGFEVLDFMPRYETADNRHYLPPELCRYIRLLYGTPRFTVIYRPAFNYASEAVKNEVLGEYIHSSSRKNPEESVYLYSSLPYLSITEQKEIRLAKDAFLLLSYNQKLIPIDLERIYLEYQRTKVYWLNWSNRSKKHGEYNELMNRSMLVLKLLSYHLSGAMLAAITTSLPETIGGPRNWDYRFCWLRDASMSIETLVLMGHRGAAQRYLSFIKKILRSKHDVFQIMYGIRGERVLTEQTLDHLSGYKNSRPVRIGNGAYNQRQNDSFGYLMSVIHQYYLYFPGTLDEIEWMWEIVKNIVRTVYEEWRKPDKGIWEFRNEEGHFVFSKVMCWVALDRAVRIAEIVQKEEYARPWAQEAQLIKEDILAHGWKEQTGSFSQTYDNTEADASLLLMEMYGFIDASDPKFTGTVKYLKRELYQDGFMLRYRNHDDFGHSGTAFTVCTFWMIRALYMIGETEEAQKIFRRVSSCANHVGLLSEGINPQTGELLGNFPQAYSHLALINTVQLFTDQKPWSPFIRP